MMNRSSSMNNGYYGLETPKKSDEFEVGASGNSVPPQDYHVLVIRQAEEIRRLRRQLLAVSNERDGLICEVHHLKMEILASELGRLGEVGPSQGSRGGGGQVEEHEGEVDGTDEIDHMAASSLLDNPAELGHLTGTCVDDDMDGKGGIYSSSEMTRLSSSSSSSSASSSPVLFTSSSKSSSTQFHDSSEETGETGVVERRYGGPPARNAALVIQRAYRRYSMVKEFHRIKTERRLSRRINNNGSSAPGGTNGCDICVDLQDSHHHHEEISGEEEEDSSVHSGDLSRSPIPDLAEVEIELEHPMMMMRSVGRSQSQPRVPHAHPTGPHGLLMGSNHKSMDNNHSSRHYNGSPQLHAYQQQYTARPVYHHQHQQQAYSNYHNSNGQQLNSKLTSGISSTGSSPQSSISLGNGVSPSNGVSNNSLPPRQPLSETEAEVIRKRLYRVGLNLFNKKPETGVSYLVKKKFLEGSAPSVARFLISRKGLSKQMVGEYLANLQSPFSMAALEHFANEIDLSKMPIDLALRRFQSFLRMPGEAQKIERVMETFSRRYGVCNPHVTSQFRQGADTVFVLAFAIIMLNTDLHTPHLKADRRMKMEDFIKNLRGIDDGGDIDRQMLVDIYERIRQTEFRTGSDHVTQVMKVQQTIVGKKPNLALPHRRLVCYCRLYEVSDLNKKEKSGSHQREVFLFNDILVLTKIFHKKRNSVTYSFRQSYPLAGIQLELFNNQYYEFGLRMKRGDTVLLSLNARNEHDRAKFAEDLREAIAESDEMTRIETLSKENRDSGVDVGKIKRYSNSLLDINDQCKPTRRGSCGSLDSGMSISFQSDEAHQQQMLHQHQLSQSQLTTTHPPPVLQHNHQHQGSSCSNSSTSTTHSK